MRIGILISESGSESNLKSVFSNEGLVGFVEAEDVTLRLQDDKTTIKKTKNKGITFMFIIGSNGLERKPAHSLNNITNPLKIMKLM